MKKNEVILLFGAMCVLVFAWIGFTIYHAGNTSTIEEPLRIQITAIKPTFDTKTISNLKKREKVTPILESGEATATSAGSLKTETSNSGASSL